jgi:Fe2+ transport system protein B
MFWVGFITAIFLVVGYLTARLLPGKSGRFYMEVPPLRLPKLRNVLIKTTLAIVLFIFPFAFLMGYVVNIGLTLFAVNF